MQNVFEPHISLVAALWRYIQNGGPAEEYFELRDRVREHGGLTTPRRNCWKA